MKCVQAICIFSVFFACNKLNTTFLELQALNGVWQMETKEGIIGEKWQIESPNKLTSKAYFINANDTAFYETVSLTTLKDSIFYTVTSTNQNKTKAVAFKLTSAINKTFVFENPAHDFPKRIIY